MKNLPKTMLVPTLTLAAMHICMVLLALCLAVAQAAAITVTGGW